MDQNTWHEVIRFSLIRVFYPCLMIFGTIGNILCLKILLRKRFRRQSTCQYLCILAVIDILFIYMKSTRNLYRDMYNLDIRNTSLWICRTFIFFSSALSHLASWILVIVSFDRYFIVKNLFVRRRAGYQVMKSTLILIFIVSLVNAHYFQILGTNIEIRQLVLHETNDSFNETYQYIPHFVCMARRPYEVFFRSYVPISDLLLVAIIPFCLMIFTNIGIIRATMHSDMLHRTSRKQQRNHRLTIMLLSVTLAFMLLTCPSVIYICLNRLNTSKIYSDTNLVILDLLESLWYTKHALNFILYTLSGQDFRREFIKLIRCMKKKKSTNSHRHRHRSENRRSLFSDQSPLTIRRTTDYERKNKQCIDPPPIMILSKSSQTQNPQPNIEGTDTNEKSNLRMLTSVSSEHGRTSATTKTFVS